jgi:5-methylthioadenosine/S-adenosylhomocysteine deaminase
MLLVGDWVLPVSHPPIPGGGIRVADGVIQEVGPAAELRARHPNEEALESAGCALIPGLINSHSHLDLSAFRGLLPPSGFSMWMLRLLKARRKLDWDDLAASALWGAYECLRNGVTAIADTSYDGVTVARAARVAGLRARVYLEVFGLDDACLSETMARLEARLTRAEDEVEGTAMATTGPSVEWGLSPHAPYTVSEQLYKEAAHFARSAGLRMATHAAESRAEVRLLMKGSGALALAYKAAHLWTGQRWKPPGVSPLRYIAGAQALGPDMLVVHAVQVDSDDIALLAASGTSVAHCPRSNRHLKCDVAPVAGMRAAGVIVGLGTDSLASNDSLDMLAEMRAALEGGRGPASRAETGRSLSLSPCVVLRMATLDGARALGWETLVGSLEAGKRADLTVVQLPDGKAMDGEDALAEAVMGGEVRMTMVDGTVVYAGARLPEEVVGGVDRVRRKLGGGGRAARGRVVSRAGDGRGLDLS